MKKLLLISAAVQGLALATLRYDQKSQSSLAFAGSLIAANMLMCLLVPIFSKRS